MKRRGFFLFKSFYLKINQLALIIKNNCEGVCECKILVYLCTMQNELNTIKTPAIVSSYSEGVELAIQMFLDMGDDRVVNIRTTGEHSYECYTDSGSDDYFYFKIETE